MAELTFIPQQTSEYEHRFLRMKEYVTKYHVQHNISAHTLLDVDSHIDQAFYELVRPHLERATQDDLIGVQVLHESLQKPIFLSYVKSKDFKASSFTNRVYAVTQSNTTFLLDGYFDVTVSIIRHVSAGQPPVKSWRLYRPVSAKQSRHLCKSLVTVPSNGNDCGHIAVYLGQFRINSFFDLKQWKRFTDKRTRNRALSRAVAQFVFDVSKASNQNISVEAPVSLNTLDLYAKYLNSRIVVFEGREDEPTSQSHLLYATSETAPPHKHIVLELLHRNDSSTHYNLITRPASYFKAKSFCYSCLTPFSTKHMCPYSKCDGCESKDKCEAVNEIECSKCGHRCYSESCLLRHQQRRACKDRYMCPKCRVSMNITVRASHTCLRYVCKKCHVSYETSPHYCILRPLRLPEDENLILTVFDIESMFVTNAGVETHQPILLVSLTVCNICYKEINVLARQEESLDYKPLKIGHCSVCLDFMHIYRGEDCVQRFCDYVYNVLAPHASRTTKNMQVRVMAHNLKSYDGRFILRDFFSRNLTKSQVRMQGSKVICLDVANVRFQDSLNLFMCPLRKLPTTFNFSERVKKGDFPYKFNRPENQHYVGKVPPLEDYGYDTLKPSDQKALKEFHDSIKDRQDFDMQQEMERYCYADTEILLIAVMAFRIKFKSIAGFDPIRRYFTLPSMSMATFRTQFLSDNVLAVTPPYPYSFTRKCSNASRIYLDMLEQEKGTKIFREYRIGKVFADGYDINTKTVYEFLGCLFHGCLNCFASNRSTVHPLTHKTPAALYKKWQEKIEYYEHIRSTLIPDLTLISEWECSFKEKLSANNGLRALFDQRSEYYSKLQSVGPCDLRESYCGGRTENFRFMKKCNNDEVIELVDFNSLYPAVLAKYPYPIGHPEIISSNFNQYISDTAMSHNLFGFVKCKVLPPRNMCIPILPMRYNDRLEFVLCNKCGIENAKTYCTHDDEQRCLVSTFSTAELSDALANGYRICEVYEILHWPLSSDEIFREYVYKWITMKQEASGFPNWVTSDEDKDKYVNNYYEDTRSIGCPIRLEKASIRRDEISRNIAKNLLNSFYGKFAEKQNREQTVLISDYVTLWNLANDSRKVITGQVTVDENKLLVNWRFKDETMVKGNGLVNIAIASFVTSYARRELWRAIQHLEAANPNCVYYSDTDSIFFTSKRGHQAITTGHNLGQLVREVSGDEEITTIVILGPKNYAYVVKNVTTGIERIVIKAKGITLDAKTLKQINLNLLMKMCESFVFKNETIEEKVEQHRIHATKDQTVTNRVIVKVYRAVSEKRIVEGNNTYPKGFMLTNTCT